ncbi:hypothetical protein CBE01nite_36710 [Clostridium beijerinckii]|nr:hypothetical protein CBE01nite_36710 [Clostridium beijerinckii]
MLLAPIPYYFFYKKYNNTPPNDFIINILLDHSHHKIFISEYL